MVAIIHPQFNGWWLGQLVVSGLLFVLLSILITCSPWLTAHEETMQEKWLHPSRHWSWQIIARVFDPKVVVIWDFLLAGWLLIQGRSPRAIFVLATLGTVDAFGIVVKHTLRRVRPTTFAQDTVSYSFPSGHTLGITIMALMIQMLFTNFWVGGAVFIVWLLVIGSRLTLRAHYPSDIIGAILLAYGWWIGAELLYLLIMRWNTEWMHD